jgi:ribonucleoside-diphosphate reductase alpha chain
VTIYRDRSRAKQVLYKGVTESPSPVSSEEGGQRVDEIRPREERRPKARQDVIHGSTRKIRTGCGNLYVTVNEDGEGNPFEIFNQIGKAGGCAASQSEAIGRLVSLAFRSNIEPVDVVRQLKGISCHVPVWYQEGKILSCADAIAKAIEWHLLGKNRKPFETAPRPRSKEGKKDPEGDSKKEEGLLREESISVYQRGACPECGGSLLFEEGCVKCLCGYSDCG